jgi:hypothetical protein
MSYVEEQHLMDGETSERPAVGEPAHFTGIQPRPPLVLHPEADAAGIYTQLTPWGKSESSLTSQKFSNFMKHVHYRVRFKVLTTRV